MEKLETRTVLKSRGEQTAWHYHNYFELLYFEFGAGMIKVGDEVTRFQGGDAIMLPASVDHALNYCESTKILCVYGPLPIGEKRGHRFH